MDLHYNDSIPAIPIMPIDGAGSEQEGFTKETAA